MRSKGSACENNDNEDDNEDDEEEDKEVEGNRDTAIEDGEGEDVVLPAAGAAVAPRTGAPPVMAKLWQRLRRPGLQFRHRTPLVTHTQFLQTPLLLHEQHFTMSQRTAKAPPRDCGPNS